MNMKLMRLRGDNFKCLKSFEINPNGENIEIRGCNGAGKTTVYDMFLWVLFSKDSTGRKDFENRPLDDNNQPINGLTLSVEAEIETDGIVHVYRKQEIEKIVKKQITGYTTECYIDEVPKKVGEYDAAIGEIIHEETFKLLTDLRFFNSNKQGGWGWKDRRKVLLDIAGEIGEPEGFEELITLLNGRTVDEYRQVLTGQKKRHEQDREQINPRIDEIRRNIPEKVESKSDAEKLRKGFQEELTLLAKNRQGVMESEQKRQRHLEHLNSVRLNAVRREAELAKDTGISPKYQQEKNDIETGLANRKNKADELRRSLANATSRRKLMEIEQQESQNKLNAIRKDYAAAKAETDEAKCYACGQTLPADKLAEMAAKKKAKLVDMCRQGNGLLDKVNGFQKQIDDLTEEIKSLADQVEKAGIEVMETEDFRVKRFAEIDDRVADCKGKPKEDDPVWLKIQAEIEGLEKTTPPSVMEQVYALDTRQTEINGYITEINNMLAQADRIQADKARVQELEAQEKDLSQKIADVDRLFDMIGEYKAAESRKIEAAVNGMFEHVEFKLFNTLQNGSVEDCCVTTYQGIPYDDCSYGQKILIGVDIVNTLSRHYGQSVPLFIDNAESLTLAVKPASQTIRMYADPKAAKLSVTQTKKVEVQNVA